MYTNIDHSCSVRIIEVFIKIEHKTKVHCWINWRLINGTTRLERLAALDLGTLELRRHKSDLVLYYKCLHDLVALPSSEYFTMSNFTSQTQTGGNRLLRPLCSTRFYESDFFNRCVSCWNFLPSAVVDASSVSCFKRRLSNIDLSTFYILYLFLNLSTKDQRKWCIICPAILGS